MLKTGSTKSSSVLATSSFFNAKEIIPTDLPVLNIAFSGSIDGGLTPGLTVVAGMSKTFKTMLSLYAMKAFLDKHKEGIALLYDSEFGVTPEYIKSFDIDIDRVVHIPIKDVEELKFDIVQKLDAIDKKDKIFIMIDSIGNLASKKELEDAQNEKSVADMSRAKSLKSLFRIITPYLTTRGIPCIAINHVYQEMGLYPKAIVSGGCLIEDTELRMYDGTLKSIQDIEVNDMVATLEGPKPVTHTWNPETLENGTPMCYEIVLDDGYTVTCSENHPFLTTEGWVEAKDLTENHKLVSLAE
jgi:RecA/RadA recombinase